MSTIIAVFQRNSLPVEPKIVQAMLQANPDRAVDGERFWIKGPIALAQQNFWISPEDNSDSPPLVDCNSGLVIACDARLDNRSELLQKLEPAGFSGERVSNARLILNAYRQWGSSCVDHLLGDFAFTIWDDKQECIFAARDALGARNICYTLTSDCLILASEVTQILAAPGFSTSINCEKIGEFLANYQQGEYLSFYENILYLPPAHSLLVTQTTFHLKRYWNIDPNYSIQYPHEESYVEHFRELLVEAIRCRMRVDGPIGISMSGGLDSTSLTAITSNLLPDSGLDQSRLPVFSYRFNELESCDEGDYIQLMLDNYPLEAHSVICDDLWPLKNLEDWPVDPGYVLSDVYALLPEAVMDAAQRVGCRVLLAGYYGDVLFEGGYYWTAENLYHLNPARIYQAMRSSKAYPVDHPRFDWRIDLLGFGLRPLIPQAWKRLYRHFRPRKVNHFGITPELASLSRIQEKIADRENPIGFKIPGRWARFQSLTLNTFSQGAAVTRKQYNRRGIELETPYWDRRLVEFVMAVPADLLYRPGVDRYLFRQAMAGILPDKLRMRTQKTVFLSLLEKGLMEKETQTVRRVLHNPLIVQMGFIRADWLQNELDNPRGWTDYGTSLWPCISLELWLQQINKKSLVRVT